MCAGAGVGRCSIKIDGKKRVTYEKNPVFRLSPEMQNREFSNRSKPIPSNPMQLSQDASSKLRRKLNRLEFTFTISPHTQNKLTRILISSNNWRRALVISASVVRIGNGERVWVQGDNRNIRNTKNPLVPPTPRMFYQHVACKVLRLFLKRRGRDGRRRRRRRRC